MEHILETRGPVHKRWPTPQLQRSRETSRDNEKGRNFFRVDEDRLRETKYTGHKDKHTDRRQRKEGSHNTEYINKQVGGGQREYDEQEKRPPERGGKDTQEGTTRGKGKETKRIFKRRKTAAGLKIGYINMQGGRRREKWEELEQTIKDENINLIAVVETHLRDEEEPILQNNTWLGQNREKDEKRLGGVGWVISKREGAQKREGNCREHLWINLQNGTEKWALGVAYIAVHSKDEDLEWNTKIYNCMNEDLEMIRKEGRNILIVGDFNGHMEELDNGENKNGALLKEFCYRNNLVIGNLSEKYRGEYTWSRGCQRTTIDYVLWDQKHDHRITEVTVCEEGDIGCDSDHNFIIVKIGGKTNKHTEVLESRQPKWDVTDCHKLEEFTKIIEVTLETTEIVDIDRFYTIVEKAANDSLKHTRKQKRAVHNWNKGIEELIRKRKKACRTYKKSLKQKEGKETIERKWRDYITVKREVKVKIWEHRKTMDKKLATMIQKAGGEGSKKFWTYVNKRLNGGRVEQTTLLNDKGEETESLAEVQKLLDDYVSKAQENNSEGQETSIVENIDEEHREQQIVITKRCLDKAIEKLKKGKARGIDEIAPEMLKALGTNGRNYLVDCLNMVIQEKKIPKQWKGTRVRLIYKGKGKDRRKLENYRPIAVVSNLYKVFTHIIKDRLLEWEWKEKTLGELQQGFRKDRRIGDNLFIITQIREKAEKEGKELGFAFLDIEKAYDRVNRVKLWNILLEKGVNREWVGLIQALYRDDWTMYQWGNITSRGGTNHQGVKQGCCLSPLLFLYYIDELDRELRNTGKGYRLSRNNEGQVNTIPGLMFADDIVLIAEEREEMQELLNLTAKIGEKLQLKFSYAKSKIMWIRGKDESTEWRLGEMVVEEVNEYTYLGVLLKNKTKYLDEWEGQLLAKARRFKGVIKKSCFLSYNKYEVGRILWKGVAVPALTYGNDALVISRDTERRLEKIQTDIGRDILGGRMTTGIEAIQGDMAWSTFSQREMKSKLKMFGRLQLMNKERIAKMVFDDLVGGRWRTKWFKKVIQVAKRIDGENISFYLTRWNEKIKEIGNFKTEREWNRQIEKKVKQEALESWNTEQTNIKVLQK